MVEQQRWSPLEGRIVHQLCADRCTSGALTVQPSDFHVSFPQPSICSRLARTPKRSWSLRSGTTSPPASSLVRTPVLPGPAGSHPADNGAPDTWAVGYSPGRRRRDDCLLLADHSLPCPCPCLCPPSPPRRALHVSPSLPGRLGARSVCAQGRQFPGGDRFLHPQRSGRAHRNAARSHRDHRRRAWLHHQFVPAPTLHP